MKSILVLVALTLAPAAASAQGYYGGGGGGGGYAQPVSQLPGGFHNRQGRVMWGFSLGLGGMSDRGGDIECVNCDYSPLAGEASFHIGGFVGPRFALMFEAQGNVQTVAVGQFVEDDLLLSQTALMVAAQYWVTPQLWLKGGLGFAHLAVDDAYYTEPIDNGAAILLSAGYELFSARNFSVDLQGRILNGSYKGIDNNVTAASVGVGVNWF